MKWQLNTYLYLFRGYTPSWAFNFIVFFIHDRIVSYPNAEVDKRFFKSWVLHIPHCLRDLLWMVRAGSSNAPVLSSLLMGRASSFFPKFDESNHFLLEHIPWMNEFHDPGRSFKVAITTSAFFTASFTASSCSSLQIAWNCGRPSTTLLCSTHVQFFYAKAHLALLYHGSRLVLDIPSIYTSLLLVLQSLPHHR